MSNTNDDDINKDYNELLKTSWQHFILGGLGPGAFGVATGGFLARAVWVEWVGIAGLSVAIIWQYLVHKRDMKVLNRISEKRERMLAVERT